MSVAGAIKQEVLDELHAELPGLIDAAVQKALKEQADKTPANPNPPKPAPKPAAKPEPSNASQK